MPVDEHLDKAFASLDDLPVRELHGDGRGARAPANALRDFASIFRNVADAREGGWGTDIPRFHLGEAVSRADEEFVEQIANAPAPFWAHVRDALAERDP